MRPQTAYSIVSTEKGHCAFAWHGGGVVRFQLPLPIRAEAQAQLLRRLPDAEAMEPDAERNDLAEQVRTYFAGTRIEFLTVRLDTGTQTAFFTRVYDFVRKMPWGTSTTYGAIAKELGAGPEGAREVGQAMAKNPLPLLIPCHRVLAAGGKLGGFSAPGGAATKQQMLEMEGLFKNNEEFAQASLF
ncbi:methylated-DNA--[protein]-cysteine S-methyltransferase [Agrobacterium larrymoorei]|uniref:Methylated-DNA--[protein]-cysteine S-methyltransferase n=1 Tax=Agrobacterium larrymoorei TaxID=160699 RepID=A0AAF0H4N3_9HYPH|nr:methylated-DNA--[protein]-cysteine S-methyltransferase [Agrobacterium larrymoorei]WHA40189.1 methylated-DNA--[protein]-cysteine S-methyltransferase [Agrobacterium larrymoorei]